MANNGILMGAVAFLLSLMEAVGTGGPAFGEPRRKQEIRKDIDVKDHKYTGLWVTGDGQIRHELLPNGRYVEARGMVERAHEGQYWIAGDLIDYEDDTGATADGEFHDGILYLSGMVLYRRDQPLV